MSQFLNKIRDVDPNNGEAVKDALSGFFQNLNKHTEGDCVRWLRALEDAITRFPKYCMSHRNTAETYLSSFLDSSNYFYVIEAAKCAHALQRVRPPQEKAATAKICWRNQMKALCNAVHTLLSSIFPNVVDLYNSNTEHEEPSTSSPLLIALRNITTVKTPVKSVDKLALLCTRLRNVFVFIQAMLVEVYPVGKPVQPQTILEALVRALSVVPVGGSSVDVSVIKIQALRTVDALIACLGANLIPFSALIIKFVMPTLNWTSENASDESSKVRCTAYNTIVRWLGVLRAHRSTNGRGRCWEDELAKHSTDDVTPVKHVVQLTMNTQPTKSLSKKARKRVANSMLQSSNIASHMPGEKNKVVVSKEVNEEVAVAALECAETFLTVCGVFLKPATHKLFQERLIRECYALESYSSKRAIALLRALEATRKTTPPTVPPPTQHCLQLYSVLINSQQREISKFCSQALFDIRLHLHCNPPSLNFAMEVADDNLKTAEAKKAKMKERNKAALNAFLGNSDSPDNSDSIPSEVISIPDEPSSKKARLDEGVTDKISVSSDSVESEVEISDESDGEVELVHEIEEGNTNNEVTVEDIHANGIEIHTESKSTQSKTTDNTLHSANDSNDVVDTANKNIHNEVNSTGDDSSQISTRRDAPVSQEVEKESIFEAKTQLPINVSNDTGEEEDMPLSIEIAYDLPTTGKEVPVLEKMEDENLPSTNDTDDIQITCGQVVKSSQDDSEKVKEIEVVISKVNGNKSPEKVIEDEVSVPEITVKITAANDAITVDDMLADFVDEVNEEGTV